jgi:hypothetical protein
VRWLSIWRDPRIWLVVLLAAFVRVGWTWYVDRELSGELAAYEADLAKLPPEERLEAELRTADALATNVLGVDLGVDVEQIAALQREASLELQDAVGASELDAALAEVAPRPRPRPIDVEEIPVIRYEAERGWEPPAWLLAGAFGGLVALAGAAGSLFLLRSTGGDSPADDTPG